MKKSLLALSVAVGISLAGCSEQSPEELVQSAQQNLKQGDESAAIIELKNALQEAPDNAQARFMLGKTYISQGAWAAAVKELEEAIEYGFDVNEVAPLLALGYYSQSNLQQLESLSSNAEALSKQTQSIIYALRAMTLLELGLIEEAKVMVAETEELAVNNDYVKLAQALQHVAAGETEQAGKGLDAILTSAEPLPEAFFFKGQVASFNNNSADAVKALEKYTDLRPKDYRGAIFLANAKLKNRQFDEAESIVDRLLEVSNEQPFVNFMKATARFHAGDYESASRHADKAIQNGYADKSAKVIAGISALRLENKEQAYNHLSAIKNELTPDSPVIPVLKTLAIELGYDTQGLSYIENKDNVTDQDVLVLSSVTSQLFQAGEFEQARRISEKLKGAKLNSSQALLARGALRLTLDDVQGITDLEAALKIDPDSGIANVSLAQAYIDAEMWDKARKLARSWQESRPDSADGPALLGIINAKVGNEEEADTFFKEALDIDSAQPAANIYFSRQHLRDENYEVALEHVQNVLDKNRHDVSALQLQYEILMESGRGEEGLNKIKQAIDTSTSPELRQLYVSTLFSAKKLEPLIEFLNSTDTAELTDREWLYLTNSQLLTDAPGLAAETAEKWLSHNPENAVAHFQLIIALQSAGKISDAMREAKVAVSNNPEVDDLKLLLISTALSTENAKLAKDTYAKLSEELKRSQVSDRIISQIMMIEGKYEEAESILREHYESSRDVTSVWLLAKSLLAQKKESEAYQIYKEFMQTHNAGTVTLSHMAELAIRAGKTTDAIDIYIKLVEVSPRDIKALNNLAYLLSEADRHDEALEYSRQAMSLAPDNFNIMDTHATALLRAGKANEAVEVFDKLYRDNPANKELVNKYSQALVEAGQPDKAKSVKSSIR